jgi:vancomycin resistance protein YoaR
MKQQSFFNYSTQQLLGFSLAVGTLFTLVSIWLGLQVYYQNSFYPGVSIQGESVAGLTQNQALDMLQSRLTPPETTVTVIADEQQISSSSAELGLHYNYQSVVGQAFAVGHAGPHWQRAASIYQAATKGAEFSSQLVFDRPKVENLVRELKKQVDFEGKTPAASLGQTNSPATLTINPGQYGRSLALTPTLVKLAEVEKSQDLILEAEVASTSAQLSAEEIELARQRAQNLVGKSIEMRALDVKLEVNDQDLISTLSLPSGYDQDAIDQLVTNWQEQIDRPPQNAEFEYDPDTLAVTTFVPDKKGLGLDTAAAVAAFKSELTTIESAAQTPEEEQATNFELALPVVETNPEVSLAQTNDLGITERIGFGESNYAHSIPSRIHNVALTTQKISNTIVPPGAEFSFNKTLGEVSARTGFKPAYVIRGNRTELGDGGGVCQVSTTTFRAALDAGLDITKRLQHSYRVSYYEQGYKPGIDATVYSGDIDFRFVNDTDHHLLITGQADSDNVYMYIEIYGTSDGRTTEIVDHNVWGFSSALAPEYYDDPSLPPGTVKQIDWAASGVRASFKNVIKDKDGNIIREDVYSSNYRPWAAKYLRGV